MALVLCLLPGLQEEAKARKIVKELAERTYRRFVRGREAGRLCLKTRTEKKDRKDVVVIEDVTSSDLEGQAQETWYRQVSALEIQFKPLNLDWKAKDVSYSGRMEDGMLIFNLKREDGTPGIESIFLPDRTFTPSAVWRILGSLEPKKGQRFEFSVFRPETRKVSGGQRLEWSGRERIKIGENAFDTNRWTWWNREENHGQWWVEGILPVKARIGTDDYELIFK
jgi:hypothetical protein